MIEFEGQSHYPLQLHRLPPRWEWAWTGDVCTLVESGFASGEHNSQGRGVPHLRPMNINRGGRLDHGVMKHVRAERDPRRLSRGDVLFNNTNSPALVGKTAPILVDADLAFSNHMTRLRPATGVDERFLAHHLHFLWMSGFFLHRCSKHVNQASVSSSVLASTVPVAVAPVEEQRRIVEALDSYLSRVEDAVATLERVERNLKRYRASVLKAAVEGRLGPIEAELARAEGRGYEPASALLERILAERRKRWEASGRRGKYVEPLTPDTSGLPGLPEGWCWACLDQLVVGLEGGTAATALNGPTERSVLRSSAVRQGQVDLGDVRFLPSSARANSDPYLAEGDLLFTRLSGSLDYVGNCAVVPSLRGRRLEFPDRIFRARCSGDVQPHYLELCFGERGLRRPLEKAAKSTAGHQRISLSDLRAFCLPLPPVEEQARILTETDRSLSIARQAEDAVVANLARSFRLRQSILKWAFEGKLADQDPADESASALLARIRGHEESSTAPPKRPRRASLSRRSA